MLVTVKEVRSLNSDVYTGFRTKEQHLLIILTSVAQSNITIRIQNDRQKRIKRTSTM